MGAVHFGIPSELAFWCRDHFHLQAFVETGTNQGATAFWASQHFAKVYTVEGAEEFYRKASSKYSKVSNIEFMLGDSRARLTEIVSRLTAPAFFWLDAHWCGTGTFDGETECPLLVEIDAILKSPLPHVIAIDDARLFLAPPPLPHNAANWPGIAELAKALSADGQERYSAIYKDVVVVVPLAARFELVNFLRNHFDSGGPLPVRERMSLLKKAVLGK